MTNRREFLVYSSRALLLPALALKTDPAPNSAGEWRNKQSEMAYRRLGRTGFMVSEVVMGGNTISPANYEHVLLSLDAGLNYLDTAPAYGQGKSELGYGHVLKARKRDQFFLNSKISLWDSNRNKLFKDIFESLSDSEKTKFLSRAADAIARRKADEPDYFVDYFVSQKAELEAAALCNVMEKEFGRTIDRERNYKKLILESVDQSLSRIGTDHLDIMMCPHGASSGYELLNYPEIFEAFEALKKAGKVRNLGVSAHSDPAGVLDAAVQAKVYSVAMIAYNIVNHRYVDVPLERARKADLGVIAMKVARPLHHGRNNDQPNDPKRVKLLQDAVSGPLKVPQKAYLWALRNPDIAAVISEMINAQMVKDNLPLAGQKS